MMSTATSVYSTTKSIWLEVSKQFCFKCHQQERNQLPMLYLLCHISRKMITKEHKNPENWVIEVLSHITFQEQFGL